MPRSLIIEDYEITRNGDVINKHTGRVFKGQPNEKGYLRVSIAGKLQFIHRLVAEKYVPNPEGKLQVNHKDGNKLNNCADNLEWVTNQENRNYAVKNGLHFQGESCPWAKLTENDVKCIKSMRGKMTAIKLGEIFNTSPSNISTIWNNKSWKNS